MKKVLSVAFLGLFSIITYAQNRVNFTLNDQCQYYIKNSDKNFYVFNYDGESQASLYNKTLVSITKEFVSAKDVVSKVENSLISVNSTHKLEYYLSGPIAIKSVSYVNYVVEFEFKDGKVRVNAPTLVRIGDKNGHFVKPTESMLNSYGKLGTGWEKYLFVNDIINDVLSNIKNRSSEDW